MRSLSTFPCRGKDLSGNSRKSIDGTSNEIASWKSTDLRFYSYRIPPALSGTISLSSSLSISLGGSGDDLYQRLLFSIFRTSSSTTVDGLVGLTLTCLLIYRGGCVVPGGGRAILSKAGIQRTLDSSSSDFLLNTAFLILVPTPAKCIIHR
jgi:hypothetical protein